MNQQKPKTKNQSQKTNKQLLQQYLLAQWETWGHWSTYPQNWERANKKRPQFRSRAPLLAR